MLEPFGLAEGELLDGFTGDFIGDLAGAVALFAILARFLLVSIYIYGLKQSILSHLR
jgi:hypothetical protein